MSNDNPDQFLDSPNGGDFYNAISSMYNLQSSNKIVSSPLTIDLANSSDDQTIQHELLYFDAYNNGNIFDEFKQALPPISIFQDTFERCIGSWDVNNTDEAKYWDNNLVNIKNQMSFLKNIPDNEKIIFFSFLVSFSIFCLWILLITRC